ncbi:MAG TPA: endonuclease domain-containing protein [Candidatus Magasanikbacteria bacterium]|nr:endonuclease domain-containing protein [Candidatus Magasanikbacteria bacterium]
MTYASLHSNTSDYIGRRRRLRVDQTKAEEVLWQELRNKKLGFVFRRQFQIQKFIVDFYCHELRLVVELDGPIHAEQKEYDLFRTVKLEKIGLLVVRYRNDQVLFEREAMLQDLRTLCAKRNSFLRTSTSPNLS